MDGNCLHPAPSQLWPAKGCDSPCKCPSQSPASWIALWWLDFSCVSTDDCPLLIPFVQTPKGSFGWQQWSCSAQFTGWPETKPFASQLSQVLCNICVCFVWKAVQRLWNSSSPLPSPLVLGSMAICQVQHREVLHLSRHPEYPCGTWPPAGKHIAQDEPIKWMASCSLLPRSSTICVMNMIYSIHLNTSQYYRTVCARQALVLRISKRVYASNTWSAMGDSIEAGFPTLSSARPWQTAGSWVQSWDLQSNLLNQQGISVKIAEQVRGVTTFASSNSFNQDFTVA